MRKAAVVVAVIVALSAVVWWIGARMLNASAFSAASRPWPNNLGDADGVARHFPPTGENDAARALEAIAKPLDVSFDDRGNSARMQPIRTALRQYLRDVIGSPSMDVAPPPELVASWLTQHEAELRAVQRQVTALPPVWAIDAAPRTEQAMPRLIANLDLARMLDADALVQHRRGNDAAAWEDLHASWHLGHSLLIRPELVSQIVAVAIVQMSNGVAAKLSTSPPSWRVALESFDYRGAFIAAFAYESTRSYREWQEIPDGDADDGAAKNAARRVVVPFITPYVRYQTGVMLEQQRKLAEQIANSNECDPRPVMGGANAPNLNAILRRVARLRAEIEGVSRLLAWKQTHQPAPGGSACADGTWRTTRNADGSITIAFTREIAVEKQQMAVPLRWTVR